MTRSSLFLALVLSFAPAPACIATEIPPVSEQAASAAREIDALLLRSFSEDAPGVALDLALLHAVSTATVQTSIDRAVDRRGWRTWYRQHGDSLAPALRQAVATALEAR